MSRQVRYRVSALVLGALLLGGPMLVSGTANAEEREDGGRQVVFGGGGVFGLSCRSQPDVESVTVPADTTLRMVNRTGHSAKLQLGGATKGTLEDNGATDVVFRRGTTSVLMSPNCALGDDAMPLLVTAMPTSPVTMPDPIPAPSEPAAVPVTPSDSAEPPAAAGSALPDAVSPETNQQRPATSNAPGAKRTATATSAAIAAATGTVSMPQGGSAARVKKIRMDTGAGAPAFAGMPPGDEKALLAGVPAMDLSHAAQPAPAPAAVPDIQIAAAEPVATMESMPDSRPIGLLAVMAVVCLLGVAIGTIRAIVSQRASRTTVA